ncbi:MAG: DUF1295 domain-containing protein [Bacteroidia bacterium]|nr:DUF1295 domain-containing protein [Bacteroidia bacterium]
MPESQLYEILFYAGIAFAVPIFILLFFINAPFGRHGGRKFGPTISNTLGWVIMESPAVFWFGSLVILGTGPKHPVVWILLGTWLMHYINRTYIYPFRIKSKNKRMPVLIAAFAFIFQLWNGYLNGEWLGNFAHYTDEWLTDPRFIAGAMLFVVGFAINLHSDQILLNLRKPGETGYKIPTGGLYNYISAPNYFGEILEWCGWALMAWSPGGLYFAVWTIANLAPRALAHHRWYKEKFPDYPANRKALIPFIW